MSSISRREFVTAAAAATVATGLEGVGQPKAARKQPNVLYVFGDQHRAQSLPGQPFCPVIAPNFERFRRENFSMDTCISNYPLCTPYRAILMSGRYPQQTGIMHLDMLLSMNEGALGETFQKAGYATGYVGKWHLGGPGENQHIIPAGPDRLGFEDWQAWAGTNQHYHAWTFDQKTGEKISPEGWQPIPMTDEAIGFLKRQSKEKPWFLVVSYNPPHPPYNPPEQELEQYPMNSLEFRPNVHTETPGPDTTGTAQFLESDDDIHKAMQGYYGAITGVDEQFGRLLKALDENGQDEDTIVIYTSDHGDMMGSHGRIGKQVPFEESVRVPFLVKYPGMMRKGGSSDALFSAVDIYPTLCGLAGIPVPGHCSGRDLSGVIRGRSVHEQEMVFLLNQVVGEEEGLAEPEAEARSAEPAGHPGRRGRAVQRREGEGEGGTLKFVNMPSYRGVRTRTHTYAVTLTGRWLLYDNVADPYQLKNLVHDPAQISLMEKLDAAILAWMKSTGDTFPYVENTKRYSSFPS
ncbi:MAG: sulfatase [Acidobacteriota bacterium]